MSLLIQLIQKKNMKNAFIVLTFASINFMACSSGGNSNQNSFQNADSLQVAQLDSVEETIKDNGPWKFEKPNEDIASTIWNKFYKSQFKGEEKNGNITINENKSIDNVIYKHDITEYVEYEEGGMINVFQKKYIACYKNGNDWTVVEVSSNENSDAGESDGDIKFLKYKDGKLIDDFEVFSAPESNLLRWTDDLKCYSWNGLRFTMFNSKFLIISPQEFLSFEWNGEKFVPGEITEAEYITEENLFKKVIAQNELTKNLQINIDFNSDYAEWGDFTVNDTRFSYGRYPLSETDYAIYLSAMPNRDKHENVNVYKYIFINGELKYVSDKAFFEETNTQSSDSLWVRFYSNDYNCYLTIGLGEDYDTYKNWNWDGEKFFIDNE